MRCSERGSAETAPRRSPRSPTCAARLPMGQGAGPGRSPRTIGQKTGTDTVALDGTQAAPAHPPRTRRDDEDDELADRRRAGPRRGSTPPRPTRPPACARWSSTPARGAAPRQPPARPRHPVVHRPAGRHRGARRPAHRRHPRGRLRRRAARVGVLRRAPAADQPEHRAVLPARHEVRRRRRDDVRACRTCAVASRSARGRARGSRTGRKARPAARRRISSRRSRWRATATPCAPAATPRRRPIRT